MKVRELISMLSALSEEDKEKEAVAQHESLCGYAYVNGVQKTSVDMYFDESSELEEPTFEDAILLCV